MKSLTIDSLYKSNASKTHIFLFKKFIREYSVNFFQNLDVIEITDNKILHDFFLWLIENNFICANKLIFKKENKNYRCERIFKNGKLISFTDSNNNSEIREYDENENLVRIDKHNKKTCTYKYNSKNIMIYSLEKSANGFFVEKYFDDDGREIRYKNSLGLEYEKKYDENGNEIFYHNNYGYWEKSLYDKNNKLLSFESSEGYWEKYEYNEKGHPTSTSFSNGKWFKIIYDDDNETIIDILYSDINEKFLDISGIKTTYK